MLEQVRKTITRYNMLPRGSRVAVAVSGGPDSVCLLHALVELAPSLEITLSVAHLNHQLRGAESDEDENFVRGLAATLGPPLPPRRRQPARERKSRTSRPATPAAPSSPSCPPIASP